MIFSKIRCEGFFCLLFSPSLTFTVGLMAKNAVECGLSVKPYVKTSLSPGSGVVTYYLSEGGVTPYMEKLGFDIVGYGCMTCIGNSGPLPDPVAEAIEKGEDHSTSVTGARESHDCHTNVSHLTGDLVACGVLSGNRNFEGRIHPLTRANYLASPMLVVAYALAGTVLIDFETTPLGMLLNNISAPITSTPSPSPVPLSCGSLCLSLTSEKEEKEPLLQGNSRCIAPLRGHSKPQNPNT